MRHPVRQRMPLQGRRRGTWYAKTSRNEFTTDDHYDPSLTYKLTDTSFWAYIGQWVYDDLGPQGDLYRCFMGQYGMTDESTTAYRCIPANRCRAAIDRHEEGDAWDDAADAAERGYEKWVSNWLLCYRGDESGYTPWKLFPRRADPWYGPAASWRLAVTRALR